MIKDGLLSQVTSVLMIGFRDHVGAEATHWPPTSEVGGSNPELYVGKVIVSYQWSPVYSTEP